MARFNITDYIKEKFQICDSATFRFRDLTQVEAEFFASRVEKRGYTKKSEVKNYLFWSLGLVWKFNS